MNTQPTCKQRWAEHKRSRLADLRRLWRAYCEGEESAYAKHVAAELGGLHDYGLAFDYVAPGTFRGQRRGYWRYQISWGGPSDELRFYAEGPDARNPERVEYWFMDWFDGAGRKLRGRDEALCSELWTWFQDTGTLGATYRKAHEE